jgi:cellulose synthase/poly-beta-1,6-N-acetylglucosamine synthase-like glycosyltransferase
MPERRAGCSSEFAVKITALETLFWVSAALTIYVYAGYPLLLYLFARRKDCASSAEGPELPRVSLLISAYNEKAVITEKLKNALSLDCGRGRLEIIVISDCSDDGTDELVRQFAGEGVCLVRQQERLGKSAGLNLGVQRATGELIVFSDANSIYRPDALRKLIRHFSDPEVGYVVGNCAYRESAGQAASANSEGLYWKLETWLKERESDFGSVVGGDGAIYAIRRELFTTLRATDINDLLNPLQIIARGFRGVYDRTAVCYEDAGDSFEKEFRRKVRIISRSLNAVRRAPQVLLPWIQPRHWLALISHKLLRWFVPFYLFTVLITSLFLWQIPFYRFAVISQAGFYALAAIGWAVKSRREAPRIVYLPYYFVLVNLASLLGVIRAWSGSLSPTWQTIREEKSTEQRSSVSLADKET